MEDREIIRLLNERPQDGLREAVKKYRGLVGMVVGRVLGRYPQDAEECIADVFVTVWRGADRLRPDGSLKGLLLCAARNQAIDRWRRLRGREGVSLDDGPEPASDEDMVDTITGGEDGFLLQQCIAGMGEPDREIFIRKYFLFERVREIAARLGLDEVQVKNRLYRGRRRLRKELTERGVAV